MEGFEFHEVLQLPKLVVLPGVEYPEKDEEVPVAGGTI
jgi:hypothetical protein